MSDITDTAASQPRALPKRPTHQDLDTCLVGRMAEDISPFIATAQHDLLNARLLGWNIIATYSPQCEAEAVHAGRIVSLSFTELGLLRDAQQQGVPPELRLKYIAAAVSVNRTICDTERELRPQQRCGREEAPPINRLEPPARDHSADAQIEALAAQAM